jgi:ABC-type Mn2+/Zn2+ transport system permease subunit
MIVNILLPAFCVLVVLLGIHSYLGLRIIQRGIIFTDLAIGQMAVFGAAISLLLFDGELSTYAHPAAYGGGVAQLFRGSLRNNLSLKYNAPYC